MYRQLEDQLRNAVHAGILQPGEKLPSTRGLAKLIGVARNTVATAFDQLVAEGYLVAEVGSGTRVSRDLPESFPQPDREAAKNQCPDGAPLSKRGQQYAKPLSFLPIATAKPRPFRPHTPAIDQFPWDRWRKLADRGMRRMPRSLLGGINALGYEPLRKAIASYVGVSRGVRCDPEQVVITSGAQQGIELIAKLLLDPNDRVAIEEPGYSPARQVFEFAGARITSIPTDSSGINIALASVDRVPYRLVYVTPSSQWPLGMTMTLARRLELLQWTRRHKTWILEDDYNGEYRYGGRPLPALHTLDEYGQVIYMGTFSKVLFPALRLGYLIVPLQHLDAFANARWLADQHSSLVEQIVLTEFIEEGHFACHIRRMRTLYASRQNAMHSAIDRHLSNHVDFVPRETGLHTVLTPKSRAANDRLLTAAKRASIEFHKVSMYAADAQARGIILGFAAFSERQIQIAVRRWAEALR